MVRIALEKRVGGASLSIKPVIWLLNQGRPLAATWCDHSGRFVVAYFDIKVEVASSVGDFGGAGFEGVYDHNKLGELWHQMANHGTDQYGGGITVWTFFDPFDFELTRLLESRNKWCLLVSVDG